MQCVAPLVHGFQHLGVPFMRTYGSNVFGMSLLLVWSPQPTTASVIEQDPLDAHARLVAAIPDALERHNVMGAAVAIVEGGAVVWAEGFGIADAENKSIVTAETIFNAGSISKTVTAWGVMNLVEQGKLDLDRPVATFLTRWRFPDSAFDSDAVTVRRLLSHTAGLSMPSIPGFAVPAPLPSLEQNLSGDYTGSVYATEGSPVAQLQGPGEGFRYSGGAFVLLQLLVEEVTGTTFADYMQQEILDPLGMTSSRFGWDESLAPMAAPHGSSGTIYPTYRFAGTAGAGLYTTVTDLARFVAAGMVGPNRTAPGRGVLKSETIALMYQRVALHDGTASSGLGYMTGPLGADSVPGLNHGGSNFGWRALFMSAPERRQAIVVLTNSDNGGEVLGQLACIWAESQFGAPAPQCR